MQKIPALSIRGRKVVITEEDGYVPVGEPVEILRDLERRGFERFYIMDIEGIERNRMQMDVIERLASEFNIWVEGGFRDVGGAEDALVLGAEMAVMASKSIKSMEEVRKAVELSDNIVFSVDHFRGILRWGDVPEEMDAIAGLLRDYRVKKVVFSNLGEAESAPISDALRTFSDFQLWLGGNLPDTEFQGIEGVIIPYSRLQE